MLYLHISDTHHGRLARRRRELRDSATNTIGRSTLRAARLMQLVIGRSTPRAPKLSSYHHVVDGQLRLVQNLSLPFHLAREILETLEHALLAVVHAHYHIRQRPQIAHGHLDRG